MNKRVLILRPEPGAQATAEKARALGLDPVSLPLFESVALDWTPPAATEFDAIMMTSANAARQGGHGLRSYSDLPLYVVGAATAEAARAAEFTDVRIGTDNAASLLQIIANDGARRVLHLTGADYTPADRPRLRITRCAVYASVPIEPHSALPEAEIILVHSSRAGQRLAALVPTEARGGYSIVAISPNVSAAVSTGWRAIHQAAQPNDDALLAQAAALCKLR